MLKDENKLPRLYDFILRLILPEEDIQNLMGDYAEIYFSLLKRRGSSSAHLWMMRQIIKSFPLYIIDSLGGSMSMFKRNLILAVRVLKKQKAYSLINIFGLSIGLATFIFFAYMGGVHFSADKFHSKADNLFGVVQVLENENKELYHTTDLPAQLLNQIKSEIPEIIEGTLFARAPKIKLRKGSDVFYEERALFADTNFFKLFSFDLPEGDKERSLENPGSIILSERIAEKYFGESNPLGQTLILNDSLELKVTGVSENNERTSSIRFEILMDMGTAAKLDPEFLTWKNNRYTAFVELKNPELKGEVSKKLKGLMGRYWEKDSAPKDLYLFPLLDFRLNGGDIAGMIKSTKIQIVMMIFIFGSLMLIVASFNFINLSIARYIYRTKEIGMRKVFGARRSQLIKQYLTESVLLAFIAMIVGIIIYEILNPFFVSYIRKLFESGGMPDFSLSVFRNTYLLYYAAGAALFTGLLSGIFPAIYITKISPVISLKGSKNLGSNKRRGTKFLIVSQFVFSFIIIIISTQLKTQLYHWVHEADFGYNKSNVLAINFPSDLADKKDLFLEELTHNSNITYVSSSSGIPGLWGPEGMLKMPKEPKENSFDILLYGVDYNFDKVFKMKIIEGRTFDKNYNDENSFIVNEALEKKLALQDAVGKRIIVNDKEGIVIGVLKDFVFSDIVLEVPASVLYLDNNEVNYILARFNQGVGLNDINLEARNSWLTLYPDYPYNATTVEAEFSETMEFGNLLINILVGMGYFAALFSYFGFIGLVAFMLARKTKEISIRKVLGASFTELLTKVLRDYLKIILIANIIAIPVTYYLWRKFQEIGVMSTLNINITALLGTLVLTMLIAGVGIYFRINNVIRINPSVTIREE